MLFIYLRHTFATLSFIAEIFIFLSVGTDALDTEKWRYVCDSPGTSIGVSSILLGLILAGKVTIWWAGLMRDAVSMTLAYNQEREERRQRLKRDRPDDRPMNASQPPRRNDQMYQAMTR